MPCDAENAGADGLGCRVMQRMLVPMVWMPCDTENAGADGLGCRVMQRMLVPMVWDAV